MSRNQGARSVWLVSPPLVGIRSMKLETQERYISWMSGSCGRLTKKRDVCLRLSELKLSEREGAQKHALDRDILMTFSILIIDYFDRFGASKSTQR